MRGYVFDFDDTLAHTDNFVGIARIENGKPVSPERWLSEAGIRHGDVERFEIHGNRHAAYITSAAFAKYVTATREHVHAGDLRVHEPGRESGYGLEDLVDFSDFSRVSSPRPITKVIDIARRVFSEGHVIGVITGRKAQGSVVSMDGKAHRVSIRDEIQRFLAENGVAVAVEDIHGVGHLPGTVAGNKASVLKSSFIEKYDLSVVNFYDDDDSNLRAVAGVTGARVNVHDSKGHVTLGEVRSILEAARSRRSQRKGLGRMWTLSGLNRF